MKAKRRRRMWIRLVVYLGLIPLFYFGLCWYLASGYVKPPRSVADEMPGSMRGVTIEHEPHDLVAWASQSLVLVGRSVSHPAAVPPMSPNDRPPASPLSCPSSGLVGVSGGLGGPPPTFSRMCMRRLSVG